MKLTLNEVARSLDLPLTTVERWIRQGRIPIKRSGHTFSFERSVLEKWAKSHNIAFSNQDIEPMPDTDSPVSSDRTPGSETLLSAMKRGGILYGIRGGSVDEVLASAVDAVEMFPPEVKTELRERLIERERLTSTGIGKGIAIPHPRTPFSDEIDGSVVFTCFLDAPVD